MTRYPTDRPLPPEAGLFRGLESSPQSRDDDYWEHEMLEPDEPPDYDPDEEPAVPPPDEPGSYIIPIRRRPEVIGEYVRVLRNEGYQVIPPDPNAGPLTTRAAPDTSRAAAEVARVTGHTVEAYLLDLLQTGGWTCDEIEGVTGRRHGSLSGAMNRLKRKGLVRESGETRPTRGGVQAAVYVRTELDPIYREGTP